MPGDGSDSDGVPTRREYLYGGAVVAGGLLAGCGGGESDDQTATTDDAPTDSPDSSEPTTTVASSGSTTTTTDSTPYTVTMEPVGEVTFESVPETWAAYNGGYADMAVALGQADGITGVGNAGRYHSYVYDELPGVSIDRDVVESNPEVRTKEQFFALDSDVHFYDPNMLINWFDWDRSDIEEIRENVGPFLCNLIFRRSDEWHDYRYYTLYGAFEKVAETFRERERYEAFVDLHDEFIAEVQSRLPPVEERPTVFLGWGGGNEPESFSPYRLRDDGTSKKQWNDLGIEDALAGTDIDNLSTTDRGTLDYENLLEIDPEVMLVRGHEGKSAAEFRDTVLGFMEEHPVASQLQAVQNGQVYRGGFLYQGPIQNLFLTERAAQQLFPEEFGDVTGDEQLFDRQRVADIVNGEF